ncbi:glycosyltransferase family 2 protein [bacterium]|jgi:glycosyltransferase involved in cell wall biosynthesis|nr:glycosyltransferase family 2 protein [bacterium]
MKVSCVMPSYLGILPGRQERKNFDKKFIRAVNSFIKQTHEDSELIIVSDGCEITNKIYEENWVSNPRIKLFKSPKQAVYSGGVRQIGLKMADGDIICYLDNDDILGKNHIKTIHDQFDIDNYDWVYYDDYLALEPTFKQFQKRYVETRWASIGTSSHAHINYYKYKDRFKGEIEWPTGYSHDFLYVVKLATAGGRFKKLETAPTYIVAHYGSVDL